MIERRQEVDLKGGGSENIQVPDGSNQQDSLYLILVVLRATVRNNIMGCNCVLEAEMSLYFRFCLEIWAVS